MSRAGAVKCFSTCGGIVARTARFMAIRGAARANSFPTRAAAVAERAKLQVKLELAKEQVLNRTLNADHPQKYRTSSPR